MTIDTEKLKALIERFVRDTGGHCVSSGACIGVVDGKQVQLKVVNVEGEDEDEGDAMAVHEKWRCVTE